MFAIAVIGTDDTDGGGVIQNNVPTRGDVKLSVRCVTQQTVECLTASELQ